MTFLPVRRPQCKNDQVVKRGQTSNEKQRYLCQNDACPQQTFVLEYRHRGRLPHVKQQIIDMALNGSGICDTARVLGISKDTVWLCCAIPRWHSSRYHKACPNHPLSFGIGSATGTNTTVR